MENVRMYKVRLQQASQTRYGTRNVAPPFCTGHAFRFFLRILHFSRNCGLSAFSQFICAALTNTNFRPCSVVHWLSSITRHARSHVDVSEMPAALLLGGLSDFSLRLCCI